MEWRTVFLILLLSFSSYDEGEEQWVLEKTTWVKISAFPLAS